MFDLLRLWERINTYVTIGLAAALAVTSIGWYVTDLKLDKEVISRQADKNLYEKAQAEYEAKALKQKQEIEERNRQRAEEADKRYSTLLSEYSTNLLRYKNAQRTISRSNLPSPSPAPESSDGPGPSTDLPSSVDVVISYGDAEICAVNTARLKAVQEWATSQ